MKTNTVKAISPKLLIAIIAVFLVIIVALSVALLEANGNARNAAAANELVYAEGEIEEVEEDPGIPLSTKYIVLSYPSELEDMVTVRYEDLEDGQQVIFTTDFTGEELELFRFSISKSGTDGYQLGVLTDEKDGDLLVCMHVQEYSNGNWKPSEFTKLNAMQERVNDIIVQFHDDPRFEPTR